MGFVRVGVMNERIAPCGELRLVTWNGDVSDDESLEYLNGLWRPKRGRIVRDVTQPNLITNVGRALLASLGVGAGGTVYGYIGVTLTAITPAATDTVLASETFRKACSTVAVLSTYYLRFVTNFLTSDWNGTGMGFGLFDAVAAGNMGAIVATSVVKSASQALVSEWRIQVTAA